MSETNTHGVADDNDDADTTSGGAPAEPEVTDPQGAPSAPEHPQAPSAPHEPAGPPGTTDPDGTPVENPSGG